jgi:hypothetical protein
VFAVCKLVNEILDALANVYSVCTLSNFRVLPPALVDTLNTYVTGKELCLVSK